MDRDSIVSISTASIELDAARLIALQEQQVEIYRSGQEPSVVESPISLFENLPLAIDYNELQIYVIL
jgi:hypothetical protein